MNSELSSVYSSVISCNFILLTKGFRHEGKRSNSLNRGLRVFLIGTTSLITFTKWNVRLLIKTKYQPVKQLLMNYQTVVDEPTSRCPSLLSPSLFRRLMWRGGQKKGPHMGERTEYWGHNGEEWDKVSQRADNAWSWGHVEGKKKSRRAKISCLEGEVSNILLWPWRKTDQKIENCKNTDDKWSMLLAQIKKCKQVLSK